MISIFVIVVFISILVGMAISVSAFGTAVSEPRCLKISISV